MRNRRAQYGRGRQGAGGNNQITISPDAGELMVAAGVNFAKKHYVLSSSWIIGLLIGCLFTGFAVTPEVAAEYDYDVSLIDIETLTRTESAMVQARAQYYNSRSLFMCLSKECTYYQDIYKEKDQIYQIEVAKADAILANAKNKVGLFSEYGVGETRDLFWQRFSQGGRFAKRQTMWDALFMGLSSMGRDEQLASFVLRIAGQFIMNLTIGLFGACVWFVGSLWTVVSSFNPSLLEGGVFWALAALAAFSFLATFLIGMYSAAAGTVYVVAKAAHNQRLEQDRQNGRVNYNQQAQAQGQQSNQDQGQARSQESRYRNYDPPPSSSYDDHNHMD